MRPKLLGTVQKTQHPESHRTSIRLWHSPVAVGRLPGSVATSSDIQTRCSLRGSNRVRWSEQPAWEASSTLPAGIIREVSRTGRNLLRPISFSRTGRSSCARSAWTPTRTRHHHDAHSLVADEIPGYSPGSVVSVCSSRVGLRPPLPGWLTLLLTLKLQGF